MLLLVNFCVRMKNVFSMSSSDIYVHDTNVTRYVLFCCCVFHFSFYMMLHVTFKNGLFVFLFIADVLQNFIYSTFGFGTVFLLVYIFAYKLLNFPDCLYPVDIIVVTITKFIVPQTQTTKQLNFLPE